MGFHSKTKSESSQSSVVLQRPGFSFEPAFTDHYEILQSIGEGGFSKVNRARHILSGTEVVVKVLVKSASNLPLLSEPDLLASLDHPNVIQLFQVIETIKYMYIVLEYAGGGHLRSLIPEPGGMPEEEARRLFRQIAGAVLYCHQKGIVHLDLKPENIALDDSGNVKLIDFGLGTRVTPGQKLGRFWGTLLYLPPEFVQRKDYEGPPADAWSLGIVLYFMLTGRRPFMADTSREVRRLISNGTYRIPKSLSQEARSLIREILRLDPLKRPSLEQILGHPWLTGGEEASPSTSGEALPKFPDPEIITTMFNMGYYPYNIWVSLKNKKYDDAMATYLLLEHQRFHREGQEGRLKRASRMAIEPPLSVDTSSFLSKKRSSEPPPPSLPSQQGPVPSSKRLAEDHTSPSQGTSTRQSQDRISRWKRVRRRISTCLRQLCCVPCFGPSVFKDRVAPEDMPNQDQ